MSLDPKGRRGGDDGHREILDTAAAAFDRGGYDVRTGERDGDISAPDAIAEPWPGANAASTVTGRGFADVFGDAPLAIEVETGVVTEPVRILLSLASAVRNGQRCVFVVPAGENGDGGTRRAQEIIATIRGRNPDDGSPGENDADGIGIAQYHDDGVRRYYNSERDLFVDGGKALQPKVSPPGTWYRTGDGEIVYRLGGIDEGKRNDAGELVRFKDPEALEAGQPEFVAAKSERDDVGKCVTDADGTEHRYRSDEMVRTEWQPIPKPFVPEIAFAETPTHRDYAVAIAEPDRDPETAESGLYRYDPETDSADPIHH